MTDKMFINCEKCGKRLIERLPNGCFRFKFGRKKGQNGPAPVDMYIHGSLTIKCINGRCGHYNHLTLLPNVFRGSNRSNSEKEQDALITS